MVFNNPAWDYKSFNVDSGAKITDAKMAQILNTTDPDLSRFKNRGGKLILYHGWSDAAIPPQNTIDYYQSVLKKMGSQDAGGFIRMFLVPGMQHCTGGAGPNSFGQLGPAHGDAGHNISAALEQWVEQGIAPERIIATKFKNPMNAAAGVERTRPLCAYPKVARYKGSGSTEEAANFLSASIREDELIRGGCSEVLRAVYASRFPACYSYRKATTGSTRVARRAGR